jgi:2-haloacid dehalogenase
MAQIIHLFDAYGTLFDVHAAVARHRAAVGPAADALSELWRTKQLEYTWIHSLVGKPVSFRKLLGRSLDFAAAATGVVLTPELRGALIAAYDTLSPYPEVKDALVALKRKQSRVAILSNGDPDLLDNAARAADIAGVLDASLSVSDAGVFKPAARAYRLGMTRFGANREDITFVSSNRWDVAGATAFGFKTVWINRSGRPDEYPEMPAGVTVASLLELPLLTGT